MKFNQQQVIDKLKEVGANRPCQRCGNKNFTIIDGFSKLFLQDSTENISGLSVGGPVVPVILIACSKCGAITTHSAGVLGLMDGNNESK